MKKYIYIMALMLIIFCGCENNLNNTPTRQAEIFLSKYQTLHEDVLNDLDSSIQKDKRFDTETSQQYRNIMKKHYQDLEYEILEEQIDGDKAVVTVKIEVDDYRNIDDKAREIYENRQNEDQNDDEDISIIDDFTTNIMSYRLEAMKNNKDRIIYTIKLNFTKKDKKWVIDALSPEILDKINGTYE